MSLLDFAGNVAGALIGAHSQRKANEANERLQREFAQYGVRWKVEDAKAAGLHPLYALGGSGASFTPSAQPVFNGAELGQNLSRAARALDDSSEQETHQAQLEVLKSQAKNNYAQAAAVESEQQRAWLNQYMSKPLNLDGMGIKADPFWALSADFRTPRGPGAQDLSGKSVSGIKPGKVVTKADEVTSPRAGDPSVTAGSHSAMREYNVTPWGLKMRLPYSEEGPGEAMENVPMWAWPALIQHQRAFYGDDWGSQFIRQFIFNNPPRYRQMPSRPSRGSFRFGGGYKRGPGRSQ